MRKYLTSAVLLVSTSFLAATYAHDDRQQDVFSLGSSKFSQDARNIIFDRVPLADLQNLCVACPLMKDTIGLYQQHHVPRGLVKKASSSQIHQTVTDDIAIIGMGKTKAQTKVAIHEAITKHLKENFFISVEMGCPLSPYLLTHPDLQQVNIADFGNYPNVLTQIQQLYAQIFKESLPEETTTQRHALDAFAAVFPVKDVYFSKEKLEEKILAYLQTLLPFKETYRTLLTDALFDETSHIVISDTQLQDQQIQTKLKTILTENPDHTVVLTLGNSADTVDAQGKLNHQNVNRFVSNTEIKHLQLMNPRGNVKVIGNMFLSGCNALTSLDTRGLVSVQSIESGFLSGCRALTDFDSRGLVSVQSIGDSFLGGCRALTSFDSRSLVNVQSIGYVFLSCCTVLTDFDSRGLVSVQSIESGFLSGCNAFTGVYNKKLEQAIADINNKERIGLADVQLTFDN